MKSPFLPLHDAQYLRLKSQTSFKIFDDAPEGEDPPYITMGEVMARDWSDKFKPGQEVFSTLHFWSDYPGRKEVAEMMDTALRALTLQPLELGSEFRAVLDQLDMNEIIIDIDGVTRHGILKIRYLIEEV